MISNFEPAHSLIEDAVSGAKIAAAPCLPALAVTQLPLWHWGGRALNGSWLALIWYSLNPLFCEHTRGHRVALEPFTGKFSFAQLWLGVYSVGWFFFSPHFGGNCELFFQRRTPVIAEETAAALASPGQWREI